jgi:hypothetical protein
MHESKKFDSREYASLLTLQNAESQAITRLARSMRLTQQSVMRSETTKHPKGAAASAAFEAPPWSKHDEEEA